MTFGTGTLRRGSTGVGVTELQQWLIDRGFLIAHTAPTGAFDEATEHATKAFQQSAGIGVDGIVGDGSRTAADAFTGTAATSGWHPTAIRNVQVNKPGGSYTTESRRGVLHTTEGWGLPNYSSPPHFTIGRNGAGNPVELWQHYPISVAARALAHPSGTGETNRFGAIQIEIITFAANTASLATDDPDLFQALGLLMRWIEANGAVANVGNHAFDGNNAYGLSGSVRLSDADWQVTTGWVGHQHVPHNTHWDPGLIDIAALLAVGVAPAAPVPAPAPTPFDVAIGNGAAAAMLRPTIRATTRQLSNAFPSLTFSVDAAGYPFFEVILTIDRTLFDPANAGRRTDQTFYASRRDGLKDAAQAQGRYVAPVPVIRAFAEAAPLGGAISYTVVGYADAQGGSPVPAADPVALARAAPSVNMLAGFRGHTAIETLGVPLSMLRPAASRVRAFAATGPTAGTPTSGPPVGGNGTIGAPPPQLRIVDPADDSREGEDGYDFRMSAQPVPDVPPEFRPPPPSNGPGDAGVPPSAGGVPAPAVGGAAPPMGPTPGVAVADPSPAPVVAYEDDWGPWTGPGALESSFPPGHAEPSRLLATDEPVITPDDEYQGTGWAGEAYPSPTAPGTAPPAAATPSANGPTGAGAVATLADSWRAAAPVLTAAQKRDVIEAFVGPDTDLYEAVNPDGEYAGAAGTDHPAYQRYHLGLSFGLAGFSQDSGELGQFLALCQPRDEAQFREVFGADAAELLEVTNRTGPLARDVPEGRSARVQPVAGADLWQEPWLSRFKRAGQHRPFQGAQIELGAGLYLDPALQFATDLDLATQRGLAIIFDRCAHRGVTGGLNWVIETVGPLQTPMLLAEALRALGFADVEAFQRSQPDLLVDDQFGPLTHAALTGALRAQARSTGATPVPVLDRRQMLDALARRATGQPWGDRIVRLVGDPSVADDLPAGEAAL
jgi:hypothetical protein